MCSQRQFWIKIGIRVLILACFHRFPFFCTTVVRVQQIAPRRFHSACHSKVGSVTRIRHGVLVSTTKEDTERIDIRRSDLSP